MNKNTIWFLIDFRSLLLFLSSRALLSLIQKAHDEFFDLHQLLGHSLILGNISPFFLVHLLKNYFHFPLQFSHFVELWLFHLNIGID